jgi:hypothetical protein
MSRDRNRIVQAADANRYKGSLRQILQTKLRYCDTPSTGVLWHYTSGHSLVEIIGSNQLYSTHVSCLNDNSEIRRAALLLHQAFRAVREARSLTRPVLLAVDDLFAAIKELSFSGGDDPSGFLPFDESPWFVACFSKCADDLSQWRAYAGGENGYAIGFEAKHLHNAASPKGNPAHLVRVNYGKEEQEAAARAITEEMVRLYGDGIAEKDISSKEQLAQWTDEFAREWMDLFSLFAPLVKDPAFKAEEEYRIVIPLLDDDTQNLEFEQRASLLARHLPLRFSDTNPLTPPKLPIAEVVVGPGRHTGVSCMSLKELLDKNGYRACRTSISAVPFQRT